MSEVNQTPEFTPPPSDRETSARLSPTDASKQFLESKGDKISRSVNRSLGNAIRNKSTEYGAYTYAALNASLAVMGDKPEGLVVAGVVTAIGLGLRSARKSMGGGK